MPAYQERWKGLRPIFFVPCTLVRDMGHPSGVRCLIERRTGGGSSQLYWGELVVGAVGLVGLVGDPPNPEPLLDPKPLPLLDPKPDPLLDPKSESR